MPSKSKKIKEPVNNSQDIHRLSTKAKIKRKQASGLAFFIFGSISDTQNKSTIFFAESNG